MKVEVNDLVSTHEIAELLGVKGNVVCNWRARHSTFPAPVLHLRIGKLYLKQDIIRWHARHIARVGSPPYFPRWGVKR